LQGFSTTLPHRKSPCFVEKAVLEELILLHHEVELAMQYLQHEMHCPKAIPPADMVGYQKDGQTSILKVTTDLYRVKPPFEQVLRIVLEKWIDEPMMIGSEHRTIEQV